MKKELFLIGEKSELFSKAHSMHDCSFVATFEQNTLVLTFDNLQNYFDAPPVTLCICHAEINLIFYKKS